jgi:hypothetical protein
MWVRLIKEFSADKEAILGREDLGSIDVNQWIPLDTYLSWRFSGVKFSKPLDSDQLLMQSDWVRDGNKFYRILAITVS